MNIRSRTTWVEAAARQVSGLRCLVSEKSFVRELLFLKPDTCNLTTFLSACIGIPR
jgi:hypothetical protein